MIAPVVAGGLYAISGSWPATLSCLVSGVLIDLDHLLDYLLEHYRHFGLRHFFETWRQGNLQRAFLLLHSWELLIVLAAVGWATHWPGWILGVLAGFGHHLILDQWAYRFHPLAYWFFWRWHKGFRLKEAFHPESKNRADGHPP